MRIGLLYPSYWPYVRRGVERYMHDLGTYLSSVGHEVDIITTKPGTRRQNSSEGIRTVYLPERTHPVLSRYRPLLKFYGFGISCLPELLRRRYDVVHAWMYPYGPALQLARRMRGTRYLYHSIVNPPYWPSAVDRWVFGRTYAGADRVAVLTDGAASEIQRLFGRAAEVLAPGVDMDEFRPVASKDHDRPQVLFTADLGDARKGLLLLLRAWNLIHRRIPQAELVLAGPYGLAGETFVFNVLPHLGQVLPDEGARRQIKVLGPGSLASLPKLYSEAAVTVLPSIEEPFGMVLIESLACGTPVVCSDAGGPGEIVNDHTIGETVRLRGSHDLYGFSRVAELADAVVRTITLSQDPRTAARCRARASNWELRSMGARVEAVYTAMLAESSVRTSRRAA